MGETLRIDRNRFESLRVEMDPKTYETKYHRVRRYPWYLRRLLKWLQSKCKHRSMKADIMEGQVKDHAIRWCETCGAIMYVIDGSPCGNPRMPRPDFEG